MGQVFGRTNNEIANDIEYKHHYTKHQLIDIIKTNKPQNINISDNFQEMMKTIELDSDELLQMSLELYRKLFEIFGKFELPPDKSSNSHMNHKNMKKAFFIKPKFGVNEIMKSVDLLVKNVNSPLICDLLQIRHPIVSMLNSEITINEYNESFSKNILQKKDMIGISKRILRDIPIYLKIRFINTFNQIIFDQKKNK